MQYLQTDLGCAGLAGGTDSAVFISSESVDAVQTPADRFTIFVESSRRTRSYYIRPEDRFDISGGKLEAGGQNAQITRESPGGQFPYSKEVIIHDLLPCSGLWVFSDLC
jgi:hypothetical protein